MTADPSGAVVVSRTIAAPPERLFRAFTTPADLARWMTPIGHAEVEAEPVVGGVLRVTMVGDGRRIEHVGRFTELDPPHRLAFTWQSQFTGDVETRVTVELVEVPSGTVVTLRHELLPDAAGPSHAGGWGAMLDRLAAMATNQREEASDGA